MCTTHVICIFESSTVHVLDISCTLPCTRNFCSAARVQEHERDGEMYLAALKICAIAFIQLERYVMLDLYVSSILHNETLIGILRAVRK